MSEQPPLTDRPTGPGGLGHPEIDELASYAAGDSSVGEAEWIRAHIQDCADCAADIDALERATAQLAELATPAMPADVAVRLDAAILRAGETPATTTVLPRRAATRTPAWASGAAAAVVVALLAVVAIGALARSGSSDDDAATSAATTQAASAAARAATGLYASGTDYTENEIGAQVNSLLRTPARQALDAAAPEMAVAAPTPAAGAAGADAAAETTSAAAAAAEAAPAPAAAAGGATSAAATSAAATTAAAGTSAAADTGSAAAMSAPPGAGTDAPALAAAPPADLAALRADPARLAQCIKAVTDGLVQPLAVDFASFKGRPALAVLIPGPTAQDIDVYVVGGRCGEGEVDDLLHFARVRSG